MSSSTLPSLGGYGGLSFSKSNPNFEMFFGQSQKINTYQPSYEQYDDSLSPSPNKPFQIRSSLPLQFNNLSDNKFDYTTQFVPSSLRKGSYNPERPESRSHIIENNKFSSASSTNTPQIKFRDIEENLFSFNKPTTYKNKYSNLENLMKTEKLNTVNTENTEILQVNIKLNNKNVILKIARFDDINQKVTEFCLENQISLKLVKPILTEVMKAMKNVFDVYNANLNSNDQEYLTSLNCLFKNQNKCHNQRSQSPNKGGFNSMNNSTTNEGNSSLEDSFDFNKITSISAMSDLDQEDILSEDMLSFNLNNSF
jgi:hypothetical protein